MSTCQEKWDATLDQRIEDLKPQLVELYTRMREQAPNARIIIMGYPRLFNDPASEELNNMLFREDQIWMNGKGDALNAMLREAAREAGVEFIDPTAAFIGHGVGAADGEQWINDLDWGARASRSPTRGPSTRTHRGTPPWRPCWPNSSVTRGTRDLAAGP